MPRSAIQNQDKTSTFITVLFHLRHSLHQQEDILFTLQNWQPKANVSIVNIFTRSSIGCHVSLIFPYFEKLKPLAKTLIKKVSEINFGAY